MSFLLEKYPNCYTDLSSLTSHMEKDRASYRDFISQYQDRILFGSDALIGMPEHVGSTFSFLRLLVEDEGLFQKLAYRNYLNYHDPSIGAKGIEQGEGAENV